LIEYTGSPKSAIAVFMVLTENVSCKLTHEQYNVIDVVAAVVIKINNSYLKDNTNKCNDKWNSSRSESTVFDK